MKLWITRVVLKQNCGDNGGIIVSIIISNWLIAVLPQKKTKKQWRWEIYFLTVSCNAWVNITVKNQNGPALTILVLIGNVSMYQADTSIHFFNYRKLSIPKCIDTAHLYCTSGGWFIDVSTRYIDTFSLNRQHQCIDTTHL